MELTDLSISETAGLIARQQISPVELAKAHLERIERVDHKLNSSITITAEIALQCARQAESEILHGELRGPLHGIPVALKDLYETKDVLTTAGSKFFAKYIPHETAFSVGKLEASGVILLGKLNMHEIALGVTNVNPHYGPCHNPWNLDCVSGGSSGGSATALSAGLCQGSLGSDTGGSIRIPASLCAVVGLKPTFGRVSLRGVIPLSWNLDHAGPMARNVRDVAILLQTIAGYDPLDPYSVNVPVEDYLKDLESGIRGWRIGLANSDFFSTKTDSEVMKAVQVAGQVFDDLGAHVEEVDLPQARDAARANGLITTSDAAAFHRVRLEESPDDFGCDVIQRLRDGAGFSSTEYILARRTQTVLRRQFTEFFEDYDLLLTPTTPVVAPPIEGPDAVEQARLLTRFTAPFNLTGLPAISLPCGFSQNGLPIGLQIIARPWAEVKIVKAAHAYEQATIWHLRRPAF